MTEGAIDASRDFGVVARVRLGDLVGIHSVEGVHRVSASPAGPWMAPADQAWLIRLDGQVYAFYDMFAGGALRVLQLGIGGRGRDPRVHLHNEVLLAGRELLRAPPGDPLVCNFIRKPGSESGPPGFRGPGVLCAVDESRDLVVLEVGIEHVKNDLMVASLDSVRLVSPGETVEVSAQFRTLMPRDLLFFPTRIILSNPVDWVVDDVRTRSPRGVFSSLPGGPVPGLTFARDNTLPLRFLHVSPADDLSMVATYGGDDPAGARLVGAVCGRLSDGSDGGESLWVKKPAVRWTPEGVAPSWR